ncbi:MAG: hypothetical protein OXI33_10515 [Chloroflexota bacterium]|nr:hypothetical protein [Chloroflexota bacterium]
MKNASIREQVERCIEEFRQGDLTEEGLQGILDSIDRRRERRGRKRRQDLLYLHTRSTSIDYPVLGMRILENGVLWDGPRDPDEWPYKTVVEAVNDGWRIIKFPEMALLLDESRSFGLGCEFILERTREA